MNQESMRCPTCRAEQPWSDTCRRCKSDLRLLRELTEDLFALREECLRSLHRNQPRIALEQARLSFALHIDSDTRRLLAVCEFLNRNWAEALVHAGQITAHA
jgi:hypothetical protein